MNIGIFSKLGYPGGSEFRSAYMCAALARYTEHQPYLLGQKQIHPKLLEAIHPDVKVIQYSLFEDNKEVFKELDHLLIINSDSKLFTLADYWTGKHPSVERGKVDLSNIKGLSYIFNYKPMLKQAFNLPGMKCFCSDIRIFCANQHFVSILGAEDSLNGFPKAAIESPIDPDTVSIIKHKSDKIRIGRHAVGSQAKFNPEIFKLIEIVNSQCADKVEWDFMGVPAQHLVQLNSIPNVTAKPSYTTSVKDYLKGIDIFLHYPRRSFEESWSRAVAEAMMSGCAVVATNTPGGNQEQITPGKGGLLCKNLDEFVIALNILIEDRRFLKSCEEKNILKARGFTPEVVIHKFLENLK